MVLKTKKCKISEKLHFGVAKKDPGLVFHFHVLNLCKCWSNLRFDQNSNEPRKLKKIKKNEKPSHAVLLCHIVTIQVDKQF